MQVNLECNAAELVSTKALEGNSLHIQSCARFTGELVHADRLFVASAGDVRMSSLYCKAADIQTDKGSIVISQSHGMLQAFTSAGDITVGSSDGYVDLRTESGSTITFHVHQLPPAQQRKCLAYAPRGSVSVSIDEQIEGGVNIVTASSTTATDTPSVEIPTSSFKTLPIQGEMKMALLEELPRSLGGLALGADWTTSAWIVENYRQSDSGSRTIDNATQSGKINAFSAQKQSLDRFVTTANGNGDDEISNPTLVCIASNGVNLTSDSWKKRIARKFKH